MESNLWPMYCRVHSNPFQQDIKTWTADLLLNSDHTSLEKDKIYKKVENKAEQLRSSKARKNSSKGFFSETLFKHLSHTLHAVLEHINSD